MIVWGCEYVNKKKEKKKKKQHRKKPAKQTNKHTHEKPNQNPRSLDKLTNYRKYITNILTLRKYMLDSSSEIKPDLVPANAEW